MCPQLENRTRYRIYPGVLKLVLYACFVYGSLVLLVGNRSVDFFFLA